MNKLKKIEEKYNKFANDKYYGACFECCDFEKMLEETHAFYSKEIKELIEEIIPVEKKAPESPITAFEIVNTEKNKGYNECIKDIKSKLPWRN